MSGLPLIGISSCVRVVEDRPYHTVGQKYIAGLMDGCGALPVLIPAFGTPEDGIAGGLDLPDLVGRLDGLMLTGSPSNVEPHHYGGPAAYEGCMADPSRDATTLPLIREALHQGLPLFAICRGLQELNVALGGSLHQKLWEVPGREDHRMLKDVSEDQRYAPRHTVAFTPGGLLADMARRLGLDPSAVPVNTLHGQAVDRLADGLTLEAVAPDGTVEAVRVTSAPAVGLDRVDSFALAVQWHPEWKVRDYPFYAALFEAFGAAAQGRLSDRQAGRLQRAATAAAAE